MYLFFQVVYMEDEVLEKTPKVIKKRKNGTFKLSPKYLMEQTENIKTNVSEEEKEEFVSLFVY